MKIFSYFLLFLLILSQPANADPISAIITAIGTAFKAGFTATALASFALRTLVSAGISKLVQKFKQRKQREPGIQTSTTTSGGTDPQGTVLGRFATAGHLTYQNSSGVNRVSLAHVIELGDLPGINLRRIIVDGEYSEIGTEWDPRVGYPLLNKISNGEYVGWVRFLDGTQVTADSRLVEIFGSDADRPWTEDHILSGVPYAIVTFNAHQEIYANGRPQVRFELDGPPLYDPRQDSTAGGNGTQRWNDPATWLSTENLMVIAYNVMRGITLPCGSVWGGGFPEEDLPYSEWAAAMDACDLGVGTGNRPQFRGGMEVRFEETPVDFLEEVFSSANAEIVELGGYWYPLVGSVDTYAADITEDDLLVSEGWKSEPFPGLEKAFNAVTITHPSPNALWNPSAPITLTKPDWEAEDGGERVFDLKLPMVFNTQQARQLGNALLKENRRFRSHRLPLPPEYSRLRPLQKIKLTSDWYGYSSKTFTITEMAFDLLTLNVSVSLREWDHSDFDPDLTLEIPDAPQVTAPIVSQDAGVPGFGVSGVEITDTNGIVRGVGIRATWDATLAATADGLSFQVRVKDGDDERFSASTSDLEEGSFRLEPMQGGTEYEARAKALARKRDTQWSAWLPVTTPEFHIRRDRLAEEVTNEIEAAQAAAAAAAADATQALFDAAAVQSDFNDLTNGYTGSTLEQSFNDARAANEAALAPIGGSVLREPEALWTNASADAHTTLTKPAITIGSFITTDPDFGECYGFGTGTNDTIGPAFPVDFEPGRVYKITAKVKCTNKGTTNGARVSIGVSLAEGTTRLENNKQTLVYDPLHPSAGVVTIEHYFSTDQDAMDSYGIVGSDRILLDDVVNASANKAYVHVRQNASDLTDGVIRVGSIYITDVTEVLNGVNSLRTELNATIGTNSANIESVMDVAVNDLSGTALATLFNQLQTDAGGNSATVTSLLNTQSDTDGFSLAFAGLTAETSGGKISGFKATSWTDPDGTGGAVLELLGDVIAEGTMSTNRMVVGLGKNLLENPDFLNGEVGLNFYSTGEVGTNAQHYIRSDDSDYAQPFYPTIRLISGATVESSSGNIGVDFRPVIDGKGKLGVGYAVTPTIPANGGEPEKPSFYEISCRFNLRRVRVALRIYWYQADGTASAENAYSTVADVSESGTTGTLPLGQWPLHGGVAQVPSDAAYGVPSVRIIEVLATGTNQDVHIFQPMFAETQEGARLSPYSPGSTTMIDGGRIVTKSIVAKDSVTAGSISALLFEAGAINTGILEITNYLDMDADDTGMRIGKQSVVDTSDGAYFGRTEIDGNSGFGFYIGRTTGGTEQHLRMTEQEGLEIVNGVFKLGAGSANRTTYTSSTTYSLPSGTTKISLGAVGGGGGGQGGGAQEGGHGGAGSAGGDSIVVLKDGSTTIATWSAAGGAGGTGSGDRSPSGTPSPYVPYGVAGGGAQGAPRGSENDEGHDGSGGVHGSSKTVTNYDVSGLSNPSLVITVGSGGAGGSGAGGTGGSGTAGFVEVTAKGDTTVDAGPVSRTQTANGTVSLTTGNDTQLPTFGSPGFWQVWGGPSNLVIQLDNEDTPGTTTLVNGEGTFPSARNRPKVLSSPGNATLHYRFWPMG